MITCTVDDLYDSARVRGGLTARMYLESVESERITETEIPEPPDTVPYIETVPSPDTAREATPTWRPDGRAA